MIPAPDVRLQRAGDAESVLCGVHSSDLDIVTVRASLPDVMWSVLGLSGLLLV